MKKSLVTATAILTFLHAGSVCAASMPSRYDASLVPKQYSDQAAQASQPPAPATQPAPVNTASPQQQDGAQQQNDPDSLVAYHADQAPAQQAEPAPVRAPQVQMPAQTVPTAPPTVRTLGR